MTIAITFASHRLMRAAVAALVVAAAAAFGSTPSAAELLRVGKSVPEAFSFVPVDVGMRHGLFKKYGVEIESSALGGGGRLQQAMAADGVDFGLGSGPEMASIVKGSPVKAVAAMAGAPRLLALAVRPDGGISNVDDLKGKRIGVTTVNSLTAWLVRELARQKGWGPEGIAVTPLGATPGLVAAMKTKQIDGLVADIATLLRLEEAGDGRIVLRFGNLVTDFHIHVIFATDKIIAGRPDSVRNFLKGWFDSIAFMRANKAPTVDIAMEVGNVSRSIAEHAYDELMPMFSDDGKFNPKALAVLSRSYVELKILPNEPDMTKLYTEEFLPKR
jgi:ABC-type nitrate/sulfonate/bicarbonate transport system substrate-binding protein